MRKNPVDSGQRDQPELISRQRRRGQGRVRRVHTRITPGRLIIGTLAFVCLVISAIAFLVGSGTSYASVARSLVPLASVTTQPATPTTQPATPTTQPATPTATTAPTQVPTVKPTAKPTAKPTVKPTTPPVYVPPPVVGVTPTVTTAPSPTATVDNSTPAPTTPTATPTPTPVPTLTAATPTPGSTPRVALIVGSVFVVLLVGLGAGWFYFRRMLMPQSVVDPNLPPSGARPWSRNSDGSGGMGNAQGATMMMNGGPDMNGYGPGNYDPAQFPGGMPFMNNGVPGSGPGGYGSPDMNGYGGYSDGFIPPSPQIFPQGVNNMPPPGSGAFPQMADANGFAPASQGFNAMYGMPGGTQGGYNGNNYGGPPPSGNGYGGPPSNGGIAPGSVDLNDPYLADVIRQYSQIGQGAPPQQQMPPNQQGSGPGYQQQMPPNQQGSGPGYQQGSGPGYQQGPGPGQGPQSNWLQ